MPNPCGVPKLVGSLKGRKVRSVKTVDEKKPGKRGTVLRLQYRAVTKGVTIQGAVKTFILSSKRKWEWHAFPGGPFPMSQNRDGKPWRHKVRILGEQSESGRGIGELGKMKMSEVPGAL